MAIQYPDTWVEISNLAIARIGKQPITSLTEGSVTSGYCVAYLGEVISSVSALLDWNALKKRVALARLAEAPVYGFAYMYQLPGDFVRPVSVDLEGGPEYAIEQDKVLTDAESVGLVYVALPAEPSILPGYLIKLIAAALAVRLTTPLISSEAIVQRLAAEYNDAVVLARREDAKRNYDPGIAGIRGYDWYEDMR